MLDNIGFRVKKDFNRLPRDLIEQFKDFPAPNIADTMNRFFCVHPDIKMINQIEGVKLVGSALTVKTRVADNLMVYKAIDIAQPGDVIVIDAGGDMTHSILGEIMVNIAEKKGIAGYIVNGCIRDRGALEKMSFPVFAKGANPKGPYKDGPGEVNFPVCCGGVVVNPGDVVVGDKDGIVIIPLDMAQITLERVKKVSQKEKGIFNSIEKGTFKIDWIDSKLSEKGCEFL